MKGKIIENGIAYVKRGDYYIPNLKTPEGKYNIGRYGKLHSIFIKENRHAFYSMKMLNGTWLAYLEEIDTSAKEMVDKFIKDMVIEDYKSGRITYAEAEFNARIKIYQSVNPNFDPDVEYMKDSLSRDIPSVDNSLFILARKLLLN